MNYDDEQLMSMRRTFLQEERPREYATLKEQGTLEEHLQESADRCRARARSYVAGGTFASQAAHWAIRTVLLESEPD